MSKRVAGRQATRVVRDQATAERRRRRRRRRRNWITLAAVVLLLVAGVVGWAVYSSSRPTEYAVPANATNDGGDNAGLLAAGTGPVTVEVYFDFLCPFCKQFETDATPTLDKAIAANKITLIWHPVGFLDANSRPPGYSGHSAASAGCASDYGRLKPYGEALFANQPPEGSAGLSDDQLIDIAGQVGIVNPAFAACVRDTKYAAWVSKGNDLAAQRGVTATPTVYVDGKPVAKPTAASVQAAITAAGG